MNAPKLAVQIWGIESQLQKLAEECCELAVAAHHVERGTPGDLEALFEEMADVEIVLEGIRSHYGDDRVDTHRLKKLTRLERRLQSQPAKPIDGLRPTGKGMVRAKAVKIGEETFPSVNRAAEYLGMERSTLRTKLNNSSGSFSHMGVHVAYLEGA